MVFSEIAKFFSEFSDTNQNSQNGRFPVLQEELERQKSHYMNKNTLKSTNVFDEWWVQRREAQKFEGW